MVKRRRRPWTVEETRAYQRRWRAAHPHYGRLWRKKHKKRMTELKRRWRAVPANKERERLAALARKEIA